MEADVIPAPHIAAYSTPKRCAAAAAWWITDRGGGAVAAAVICWCQPIAFSVGTKPRLSAAVKRRCLTLAVIVVVAVTSAMRASTWMIKPR